MAEPSKQLARIREVLNMKNATWGDSNDAELTHTDLLYKVLVIGSDHQHIYCMPFHAALYYDGLKKDAFLSWDLGDKYNGCIDYQLCRCNGIGTDSPAHPFPNDGIYTWATRDRCCSYIRYTEGPGDRAWMEERDRNYLARLFLAGANTEQENQDLSENRERAEKAEEALKTKLQDYDKLLSTENGELVKRLLEAEENLRKNLEQQSKVLVEQPGTSGKASLLTREEQIKIHRKLEEEALIYRQQVYIHNNPVLECYYLAFNLCLQQLFTGALAIASGNVKLSDRFGGKQSALKWE